MGDEHLDRLRRASRAAREAQLSALLITPSADLVYLTGYDPPALERLTCLVLRPEADPVLVVPGLERPLAESQLGPQLAELVPWEETADPYELVARIVGGKAPRVGCSDRMWAAHLLSLQRALPRARTESASRVLAPLRAIKDDNEIALLRRAARATDDVFRQIIEERLEGMTERDVADRLAEMLVAAGLERAAFTIVGAGPNASSPHHEAGDRALRAGEAVVMDFGGTSGGYCSDLSRTVSIGKPSREFGEAYEVVREAQERAVRAVRPGVAAEEVDRAAREVIGEAGYGQRFFHRTGHGIGLEEHEHPYIVEGNGEPLRPGMCFSIEPGIYLEGRYGIRIEDIVAVTEDGVSRLNHAERDLQILR